MSTGNKNDRFISEIYYNRVLLEGLILYSVVTIHGKRYRNIRCKRDIIIKIESWGFSQQRSFLWQ